MELVVSFFDKSQLVVAQLMAVVWWIPMANRIPQVDVIVDLKEFFAVRARFQMKWTMSLMRLESSWCPPLMRKWLKSMVRILDSLT